MLIVPEPDNLLVEARVSPVDRDQIRTDQPARLRFTSFNQRITPEFSGSSVSSPLNTWCNDSRAM